MSEDTLKCSIELHNKALIKLKRGPNIIEQFFDDIEKGFKDQCPNPVNKPHITSTAQCLRVVFQSKYFANLSHSLSLEKIIIFFDSNTWESSGITGHNMYVSPQVLIITSKLGIGRDNNKVNEAIKYIISCLRDFLDNEKYEFKRIICSHGFILYWAIKALTLYEDELNKNEKKICKRAISYAHNSLFNQLALHLAGDESLDVVQLGYYLLSSVIFGNYSNNRIIDKAIEIILTKQQGDGTWKLSHPFLHRAEGGVMNCFSIEVPTTVLQIPRFSSLFPKYIDQFKKILDWVDENFKNQNGYWGWRSDSHPPSNSPESWASALVYEFLNNFLETIKIYINYVLLEKLNAEVVTPKVYWSEIIDYNGFKKSIEENIIYKIRQAAEDVDLKKSSILLYGPPGTGKGSIVSAFANECKWPLISILPADLLVEGPEKIFKVAKSIFEQLFFLEKAVILFDEFDEFVTSREIESTKLGKFITTSMLPWLQKLKENSKIISVVTTNYIHRFDEAIKRSGRFDLILPIGPPEKEAKIKLLKNNFPNLKDSTFEMISSLMDRRMTIGEILAFCDFLREVLNKKNMIKLSKQRIKEMNEHLVIDSDVMKNFEKSLKYARH